MPLDMFRARTRTVDVFIMDIVVINGLVTNEEIFNGRRHVPVETCRWVHGIMKWLVLRLIVVVIGATVVLAWVEMLSAARKVGRALEVFVSAELWKEVVRMRGGAERGVGTDLELTLYDGMDVTRGVLVKLGLVARALLCTNSDKNSK